MEAFLKHAIKNIFLVLFFLFIGILVNFDWFFWTLLLFYVLRPFIDELAHRLKNRSQNHPPH